MKGLSKASPAVDVELFLLFLRCQMAALCHSSRSSEDNLLFSISAPGNAPSPPFPRKYLHLAERGVEDLQTLITTILEKAAPVCKRNASAPLGSLALKGRVSRSSAAVGCWQGIATQRLLSCRWGSVCRRGAMGCFCVECHMPITER